LSILVFILTPLTAMSDVFGPAQATGTEAQARRGRDQHNFLQSLLLLVSAIALNKSSDSLQTAIQNETVNYYNNFQDT
jgi:hypothetical protein